MLYYEILSPTRPMLRRLSLPPGVYAADVQLAELADGIWDYGSIAYSANRIWCEQDGTVKYVKVNHKAGQVANWEVDMAEFAWIKLKTKVL